MQLQAPQIDSESEESPVVSFIQLEYFMGVRLVQNIHASLASISKVIRGAILLSEEIHVLANSLLKHEVMHNIFQIQSRFLVNNVFTHT